MKRKYLSKSRFKIGMDCPNKLYYSNKKEYVSLKTDDAFLESLAQGGFQVEELARMHYPKGVLIEDDRSKSNYYENAIDATYKALKNENVIIYEAAFVFEDLFIRTDILIKKGNNIELIEVKAKSIDPTDIDSVFTTKKGTVSSGWKPYVYDLAFQKHVVQKSNPTWKVSSYFLLADKTKKATVNGLNQLFRITSKGSDRTGISIKKGTNLDDLGENILAKVKMDNYLEVIYSGKDRVFEHLDFEQFVKSLSEHYSKNIKWNYPVGWHCKGCEYHCDDETPTQKSGFKECFREQLDFKEEDFNKPNLFEVWSFRTGRKLMEEQNKFFLKDIDQDDVKYTEEPDIISSSHRRWIQIEKSVSKDITPFFELDGLKEEISKWKYPFHCIDFETSAVALPFNAGRRPYEQTAFQFSHHILYEDGRVEHHNEYISNVPGEFPNFNFLRGLKKSLEIDNGSIFKYANHENSILNAIYDQLEDSNESDKEELKEFIKLISHSKKDRVEKWCGDRDMIDLCEIVKKYYYDPYMGGSNSIKVVLPAVLYSSDFLKNRYSKSISDINVSSKNFDDDHIWLNSVNGEVVSPYKQLPQLFKDWSNDDLELTVSELEELNNGGLALVAFSKLQFEDMTAEERTEITNGLLKYCELDTLAMVMIIEYLLDVAKE